jgi:CubicO group peptidase (beta-lactamase class C family)
MNMMSIALVLGVLGHLGDALCSPTGPVLPPAPIPPEIFSGIKSQLDEISKRTENPFNATVNSFSVVATSKDDTVFSYFHTAPDRNATGKQSLDRDTVYRVASVTRVFTVLALHLQHQTNLDDPITKYIAELQGHPGWNDVTLRMLSAQMSGINRDVRIPFRVPRAEECKGTDQCCLGQCV